MSKIEVNTIDTQCGSALQIGDGNTATIGLGKSGDTITVPSGATIVNNGTQTGFGRTGTVDWDTSSIKTATFSAVSGNGYFCNTSGGAFTVNLPAGAAGAIVSVVDYTNTFQTYGLTISPNGSEKIGGINADVILETEGQSVTFVYVDATEGWKNIQDSTSNVTGNPFIVATGGNSVTTCGNCKIHTFTGPGTFAVTQVHPCAANNLVSYMVIGGGASGGAHPNAAGGGGAGGYRETKSPVTPYTASPLDGYPSAPNRITVSTSPGSYPITVGAGGGATSAPNCGNAGSASTFSTITSAGGGGGGKGPSNGSNGGSGGGGGSSGGCNGSGGTGNTPPVSPAQGTNGGNGNGQTGQNSLGGGAGGAGGAGSTATSGLNPCASARGGPGGSGTTSSITGSPVARAGGGGGGTQGPPGAGGTASGGGGRGKDGPSPGAPASDRAAQAGTVNTGGGGGGGGCSPADGGAGGSGIVVIRYKYQN